MPSILEAYYPGQLGGDAIVNTLLGKNNPGGKTPGPSTRPQGPHPTTPPPSPATETARLGQRAARTLNTPLGPVTGHAIAAARESLVLAARALTAEVQSRIALSPR